MSSELTFDDSAVDFVLEAFDNTVDEEGYISRKTLGNESLLHLANPSHPKNLVESPRGQKYMWRITTSRFLST